MIGKRTVRVLSTAVQPNAGPQARADAWIPRDAAKGSWQRGSSRRACGWAPSLWERWGGGPRTSWSGRFPATTSSRSMRSTGSTARHAARRSSARSGVGRVRLSSNRLRTQRSLSMRSKPCRLEQTHTCCKDPMVCVPAPPQMGPPAPPSVEAAQAADAASAAVSMSRTPTARRRQPMARRLCLWCVRHAVPLAAHGLCLVPPVPALRTRSAAPPATREIIAGTRSRRSSATSTLVRLAWRSAKMSPRPSVRDRSRRLRRP